LNGEITEIEEITRSASAQNQALDERLKIASSKTLNNPAIGNGFIGKALSYSHI